MAYHGLGWLFIFVQKSLLNIFGKILLFWLYFLLIKFKFKILFKEIKVIIIVSIIPTSFKYVIFLEDKWFFVEKKIMVYLDQVGLTFVKKNIKIG